MKRMFVFMLSYCLSYLGLFQLNSKGNVGSFMVSKQIDYGMEIYIIRT